MMLFSPDVAKSADAAKKEPNAPTSAAGHVKKYRVSTSIAEKSNMGEYSTSLS